MATSTDTNTTSHPCCIRRRRRGNVISSACCLRWRSSCGLPLGERVYRLPPGLGPLSSVALRVTLPLHQWSGGLLSSPMFVAAPKASTQAFPQELSSVSDSYFLWVALEFTPFFVFRLGLLMITKSFQKASFLVCSWKMRSG